MGRVVADKLLAQQIIVETAHGRQAALDAAAAETAPVRLCRKAAHTMGIEVLPADDTACLAEFLQFRKVAPVALAGIRGQASLGLQVMQETLDPVLQGGWHVQVCRAG